MAGITRMHCNKRGGVENFLVPLATTEPSPVRTPTQNFLNHLPFFMIPNFIQLAREKYQDSSSFMNNWSSWRFFWLRYLQST